MRPAASKQWQASRGRLQAASSAPPGVSCPAAAAGAALDPAAAPAPARHRCWLLPAAAGQTQMIDSCSQQHLQSTGGRAAGRGRMAVGLGSRSARRTGATPARKAATPKQQQQPTTNNHSSSSDMQWCGTSSSSSVLQAAVSQAAVPQQAAAAGSPPLLRKPVNLTAPAPEWFREYPGLTPSTVSTACRSGTSSDSGSGSGSSGGSSSGGRRGSGPVTQKCSRGAGGAGRCAGVHRLQPDAPASTVLLC